MAREKRVEFLRYFNDYPMIAMFTIDTVAIVIIVFLFNYTVMSIGGMPLIMIVLSSIVLASTILFVYIKTKRSSSKAFLKHWLFSRGIYRLQNDKNKWEELKHSDTQDYFPSGGDKFFAD